MTGTFWAAEVLDQLEAAVVRAEEGQVTLLEVVGAAGTGKTTLLDELSIRAGDFAVATAEGIDAAVDAYQVLTRWGAVVPTTPTGAQVEPAVAAQALRALVDRLGADDHPVLLRLDDLHWADGESVEALSWLVRRAAGERLLVAVSSRPPTAGPMPTAGRPRWPLPAGGVLRVALDGLSAPHATALVRQQWPEATEATAHRLWQHTGGNPLYLRALLEERSTDELVTLRVLPAPAEYAHDVAARLARQSPAAIRLAEAVAVLGPDWTALHEAAALDAQEESGRPAATGDGLASAARELADSELLVPGELDGAAAVRFAHALVRAAVYQQIPLPRRRALHEVAARTVTGRTVAFEHRLAAADRYDDPLAVELDAHATELYGGRAYRLAAQHYRWASSVTSDRNDRERRWLESQFAALLAQEHDAVDAQLPAVRDSADLTRRVLIEGAWHCLQNRIRDGVAVLAASDGWPPGLGDPLTRARVGVLLAWGRALLGHDTDLVAAALARADATGTQDPALVAYALMARGHVLGRRGGRAVFTAQLEQLPVVAAATPPELSGLLRWRGVERVLLGDVPGAVGDLEEVRHRQHDGRADPVSNGFDSMLALAHWFAGDWDLAQVHFRASLDAPPGSIGLLTYALAALPACGAGRPEEAERLLQKGGEVLDERPWQEAVECYLLPLVVQAHAAGTPEQRRRLLPEMRRRWPHAAIGTGYVTGLWALHLALAQLWAGDLTETQTTLDEIDRLDPRAECLDAMADWVRALIAEARGDRPSALALLRRAAERDCTALPLYRAHIHVDQARLAAAEGSTTEARAASLLAQEGYRALGATPYLDLLGLATSAGPFLVLTEREHDVLTLLVAGYSYAQIGRDLFISDKTVGYHLSNIYAKAGVGSRHELIDWVRSHPGVVTVGNAPRRR